MALASLIATAIANPQFGFNNNGFFNRPAARPNQAFRGNGGNCSPTLNYQSGKGKHFFQISAYICEEYLK